MLNLLESDIRAAMLPEMSWDVNDDACDCTFQRIGMWANPYIGETMEVRMCCIWEELYKLFPGLIRKTQAYRHGEEWVEPWDWDGETDMPRSIWYRQLARQTGRTLPEIREAYGHLDPPKGTPRPVVETTTVSPFDALEAMVTHLAERIVALEAK